MKTQNLLFSLFLPVALFAQASEESYPIANQFAAENSLRPYESRFTGVKVAKSECLNDAQLMQLKYQIQQNRKRIVAKDAQAFSKIRKLTLFQNPFRPKAGFNDYGYHTLNYQVDHNLTPNNNLLDYNCGTRTYDWVNGNHAGTDYILWPYPWKRLQENVMEIVAAAPGIIVEKRNSFADLNCTNNGNPNWNGIVVEHADGTFAIYMHFKKNSATTKEVGDTVTAGEFLGLAGSSGSSTIPHLHFEIRDPESNVIDPYQGNCNAMNAESWWQQQEPYYVPRINRISTHSVSTNDTACPVVENTYEKTNFDTGDPMVLKLYYRDIKPGDVTAIKITGPSGNIVSNYTWTQDWGVFYATAWAYWTFNITSSWETGIYNIQANFGGNSYTTAFGVRTPLGSNEHNLDELMIYPNPVRDVLTIKNFTEGDKIEILDSTGRLIRGLAADTKTGKLNVSVLQAGNYYLKISVKDQRVKLLKFTKK